MMVGRVSYDSCAEDGDVELQRAPLSRLYIHGEHAGIWKSR